VHGHAAAAAAVATPGLPPARLDDSLREAPDLTLLLNADETSNLCINPVF